MSSFSVNIICDAEEDILTTYRYIYYNDSRKRAEYVLSNIQKKCESLSSFPECGHYPPELERIGIYEFREIHFKPYRIIYNILDKEIFVHAVIDGRRSVQDLLEQRLLR